MNNLVSAQTFPAASCSVLAEEPDDLSPQRWYSTSVSEIADSCPHGSDPRLYHSLRRLDALGLARFDVRDIRWMRKWCAILFVITAVLISVAAGAGVTMVFAKRQFRQDFHEFAAAMKKQVDAGNHRLVSEELNLIVNPDAEAPGTGGDILHRMQASKTRLQSGQQKTSTVTSPNPRIRMF